MSSTAPAARTLQILADRIEGGSHHPVVLRRPGGSCTHTRIIRADSNIHKAADVLGRRTEHRLVAAKAPVFDRNARQSSSFRAGKDSADAAGVLYGG